MNNTVEKVRRSIKILTYFLYFLVAMIGWCVAGVFVDQWFIIPFIINVWAAWMCYGTLQDTKKILLIITELEKIGKRHEANL